jgi:hypothetical protein
MKSFLPRPTCLALSLGLLGGSWSIQAFVPVDETRLPAPTVNAHAIHGASVAADADRVIVGAASALIDGIYSGAAYVFVRENGAWRLEVELTANDPVAFSDFGYAVAIDGNTAVVGAPTDPTHGSFSGAVYVFVREVDGWRQQAKLFPNDPGPWLQFGDPVAIDGDRLVAGAFADSAAAAHSGAAYVFLRNADGDWQQEAKLKAATPQSSAWFGFALDLRGDRIGVGAPFSSTASDQYVGNVTLFERIDDHWTQTDELWVNDPTPYALVGWSVALGDDALLVGAPLASGASAISGAAYLFQRGESGWNQSVRWTPDDASGGEWFGYSVALRGATAAVGASQDSAWQPAGGGVYLFQQEDEEWTPTFELTASDVTAGSQFGYSVAFDGQLLVVGAPFTTVDGFQNAGAAYVFTTVNEPPVNEPPVADASASDTFGIASGSQGATITLDASRSYDPDGDPLEFEWYQGETLLAAGIQVTVVLSVGTHDITLLVSDPTQSATDAILIRVVSVTDAVQALAAKLELSDLPPAQATALRDMLNSAMRALDRHRIVQAVHHLEVFRNHLQVQSGKQIDTATARELEAEVERVLEALTSVQPARWR